MRFLWAYAGAGLVFLAADFIWLGFVARGFYREHLGALMLERPNMAPAIAFYALFVAAIVFFAITPGMREQSWKVALVHGALLGGVAYATYDLTNLATLKIWPTIVAMVDLAWGSFITAIAATAGFAAASYMQA
jgi:uncharacterized membrane protein